MASDDPSASTVEDTATKPHPHFEFGIYGTMYNTYNRGNLDTWFSELTADPDRKVDQGSPAYFGIEGAVLFPLREDELWMGASFAFALPASHSLWGTQTFFGGRQELDLSPWVFSFGVPIRYRLGHGDRLFATATPAMLMGWVSGDYTSSTTSLNFTPSPAFGFGMAVGAQALFAEHFAVDFKVGFRKLKTDLTFEDNTSGTGYSQPLLNNGEGVQADLGGSYMTIGVSLHR